LRRVVWLLAADALSVFKDLSAKDRALRIPPARAGDGVTEFPPRFTAAGSMRKAEKLESCENSASLSKVVRGMFPNGIKDLGHTE
jgi:hypothetical protein